ncbi:putative PUA-like superfamily, SRA-YDG superfamily protein [Helianthus anomalus]
MGWVAPLLLKGNGATLKGPGGAPDQIRRNKHSFGSKPAGKVKFWDPTKESHNLQPIVTTTIVVSRGGKPLKTSFGSEHAKREKIKEAMRVYDKVYTKLLQAKSLNSKGVKISHWRVSIEAVKLAKQTLKWMEPEKSLGRICGVRIGDKFKHRAQLKMIGLHCQPLSGIDYANINGKNLAISIVDSHRYSNESASSDKMIYCGHGGLGFSGRKLPREDQKLKCGNMAMKNSMDEGTAVRVIRKVGTQKNEMFVYDGLYVVSHCTQKRNEGKIMFWFYLDREPGQPPLHQMLNENE